MKIIILLVLMSALPSFGHACGMPAADVQKYLALDFSSFDQTAHQGPRKFAEDGCYADAAELTDLYLAQHQSDVKDWQIRILIFHAGQYYAMQTTDRYQTAIERIEQSHDPHEELESPLTWNIYVDATLAFLRRDLATLKTKRTGMNVKDTPMQETNKRVVNGLIKCFNKPYLEAYGTPGCYGGD